MIDVEVHFIRTTFRNEEVYYYPFFHVRGHANDGSYDAMKVCASVTAMVQVIPEMKSIYDRSICELEKGYFLYKNENCYDKRNRDKYCEIDVHYALNTILWQLTYIKKQYPYLFSSFIIKEIKK